MAACTRADCGGSIAADGYCNTCGYAASAAAAPSPAAPTPAVSGAASTSPPAVAPAPAPVVASPGHAGQDCNQPHCDGSIAGDGYCNTCGMVPRAATAAPTSTVDPATGQVVSTGASTGSGSTDPVSTGSVPTLAAPSAPAVSSRVVPDAQSSSSRRTNSRRLASARTGLGVGLVSVPPTATGDPAGAVMSAEKIQSVLGAVPEDDRYCTSCGRPVGRADEDGEPGRIKGFCGTCRTPFDFVTNAPALAAGDLVGGQYEILGPLAHGGMGWIYLGRDQAVSGRWVVLKGLLNENDPDAIASAVAERQFLAQIEHGNIVNIYNFVTWAGAGYIVMEFVGGQSLTSKLKARRRANNGAPNPLPVTDAIAYILGVLPALGYLHRQGLVYNDLKPANVMATGDEVKLIDVGGVMHVDDQQAAIFGTQGFQAPEVAVSGPSVASDLFTVGRTLAVLMLNFRYHDGEFLHRLPSQDQEPLFVQWESLYRFLLKSTAEHPDDRFQTSEEMTMQLTGVLREIVAIQEGAPKPTPSTLFGTDRLTDLLVDDDDTTNAERPDWRSLPYPKVDPADPAAAFLLDLPDDDPEQALTLLNEALQTNLLSPTPEVLLVRARLLIGAAATTTQSSLHNSWIAEARKSIDTVDRQDPWEWRVTWLRGLLALEAGQAPRAAELFGEVWTQLPGEVAPIVAVGLAAEIAGAHRRAAHLYQTVVSIDPTYVTASFGLARSRAATGDRQGAVTAYRSVPASSATYLDAQVASARTLVLDRDPATPPTAQELDIAARTVERLQLDSTERARLSAQIFEEALEALEAGKLHNAGSTTLFGHKLNERSLRTGLESTYRELARTAATSKERIGLIDRANEIRPFSLF